MIKLKRGIPVKTQKRDSDKGQEEEKEP